LSCSRDRENGFIVDYSNKKAADIISELMHRDLTTIGGEARKTAEVYDWKNTVKKIEKLYNSVSWVQRHGALLTQV